MSDNLQVSDYNPITPPGRILIGAYLFNFNNHNRADPDDREMWIWDGDAFPASYYSGYYTIIGLSPALSRTDDYDTLKITLILKDSSNNVVCWVVDTKFLFNWDSSEGSSKRRAPWLKKYFSLDNWNNFHADYPEYEDGD